MEQSLFQKSRCLFKGLPLMLGLMAPPALADTISVGGTGSAMGIMQLLGDAFSKLNPEHKIRILPSLGTSGGIQALKSGAIEIAIASRELKPQESTDVMTLELGKSPFIFIAHAKVKENNITQPQVHRIYSGQQPTWSDGSPLRPILRPLSDSDSVLLQKISPETEAALKLAHAREGMSIAITDTDAVDMVEKVRGSFCTSTLVLVAAENRGVKILSLDGVMPSIKAVSEGKYKYTKTFHLLHGTKASESTRKFVAFILSASGKAILEQNGMLVKSKS